MVKKANKPKDPLRQALQTFDKTTKDPTDYLKEQKEFAEENRVLLKSLFDYAQSSGPHFQSINLPDEIYVDHMDEEQIWQQLEMQNDSFWQKCMAQTCRLLSLNENKLTLNIKYENDEVEEEEEAENGDEVEAESENGAEEGLDEEGSDEELSNEESELDAEDDSDKEADSENDKEAKESKKSKNSAVSNVVNDKFFNFDEMEEFLNNEDQKELDRLNGKRSAQTEDESEEEIDYFDTLESDEEDSEDEEETNGKSVKEAKYGDFFKTENEKEPETKEQFKQRTREEREAKNRRKRREMVEDLGMEDSEAEAEEEDEDNEPAFLQDENDDDSDDEPVEKSEFGLRQDRLRKRIEELEENAVSDKPWQLKGEITSSTRPKNSLLEEVLEFDSVARPAPLITEETTVCLEDIIKRRIKSKAWDDVERKIKPVNDDKDFRKALVLNQEKSKESLAQIYEKDYLDKVQKLNNVDDGSKPDEPKEHTDIRRAMKDLFIKLDALSNFHFTSKPVAAEAKIITNIPAIEMEEVAPVAVSDATLLAPEEVKARPVGDEIGKTERTDVDKKRERRKKKQKQKLMQQQNDRKVEEKEKLGIKVTDKEKQKQLMNQVSKSRNVIKGKNTSNDENKALKSSKSFFTQLQDNVTSAVKSKSLGKKKAAKDSSQESSAKRFKL